MSAISDPLDGGDARIIPRLPVLASLRGYQPAWSAADIPAGPTIAAVGIPGAIACDCHPTAVKPQGFKLKATIINLPNGLGILSGALVASKLIAMGTMDEVAKRYGPALKAFLLITSAGSFFVDLANAFIAKGFLALDFLDITPAGG